MRRPAKLLVFLLAVLLGSGMYLAFRATQGAPAREEGADISAPAAAVATKTPIRFIWDMVTVEEGAEAPTIEVYIETHYSDGTHDRELVDTVTGECSVIEGETPLALDSGQVTCYHAGLGHSFRVVETDAAYLVQQRTAEEALPTNEGEPLSVFETKVTVGKP